jgi:thioesterase domain-containing protein
MHLTSKINTTFKTTAPLSTLFHAPTIATLAELLEKQRTPPKWFSMFPNQTQGSRPPLFCVEVIGSEFFKAVGQDQPIYSFRFGVGAPPAAVLRLPMIPDLAAHYIEELQTVQPKGPYFLVGYSWGGLVAYEMAQQLTEKGEVVELVAMVDTAFPISSRRASGADREATGYPPNEATVRDADRLTGGKLFERIKYKLLTRVTIENSKTKMMKLIYGLNYYRPDDYDLSTVRRVASSYLPRPYSGKVCFFHATVNLEEWKRLVGQGLKVEEIRSDHAELMRGEDVAKIVHRIRAEMDRTVNRGGDTEDKVQVHLEDSFDDGASSGMHTY